MNVVEQDSSSAADGKEATSSFQFSETKTEKRTKHSSFLTSHAGNTTTCS